MRAETGPAALAVRLLAMRALFGAMDGLDDAGLGAAGARDDGQLRPKRLAGVVLPAKQWEVEVVEVDGDDGLAANILREVLRCRSCSVSEKTCAVATVRWRSDLLRAPLLATLPWSTAIAPFPARCGAT